MKKQLKSCPFCGGEVTAVKRYFVNGGIALYLFKCRNPVCHAIVSFDNVAANLDPPKAFDNFNTRMEGE